MARTDIDLHEYLTLLDIAELMGISAAALKRRVHYHNVPRAYFGRVMLIRKSELARIASYNKNKTNIYTV